ncbi:thiamine pyrophosphate-dependent enzyme [Chloroflexota bacterium]
MKITEVPKEEYIAGSMACAGCGELLATRLTLKVLGKRTVLIVPAGCMSTVNCYWPQLPFRVPMFVGPFAATGAILAGTSAGFRARGINDINVVGLAGDGATADIGLASLSQAIVGRRKFIYICLDNEAYMNTGIQWSSTTPYGAITTTTPLPEIVKGAEQNKKDLLGIVMAHNISYAATACPSYPFDFMEKIRKAASIDGPTFIHVLAPCPSGWGFPGNKTIELGRMAVESGMWYLCEYENGKLSFTYTPKKKLPVSDYLKTQARFRRMKPEHIDHLQSMVDKRLENIEARVRN